VVVNGAGGALDGMFGAGGEGWRLMRVLETRRRLRFRPVPGL